MIQISLLLDLARSTQQVSDVFQAYVNRSIGAAENPLWQ